MKRKTFIFLALVLMLLSIVLACEKAIVGEGKETTTGDPDGNVQVTVYQVAKTPFASLTRAGSEPSTVITRLNFAVYDQGGSRLKQINQMSSQVGFGNCSFQIEEGSYQLVVVDHSASGNPTMTNPAKIQFTNSTGYTDTFLYYGALTIGAEQVNLQVALDRIVALCRFVITDDIPAEVKTMRFYYTGGSGAFNAATGLGCVASKQTVMIDVASGQKQFDLYTFLHEQSDNIALKVTALDANSSVLYERDFDVPMEQNHITWLTGAFFSGAGSSSSTTITVTVNTDWAGETHLTF